MAIARSKSLMMSLFILSFWVSGSAFSAERGTVVGGVPHTAPDWFKESFLEIADDVDEASEEGKHVMLFFQLNACPYCDRMLTESFETEPLTSYIQEHFDTIAINVKGDREIAFNEELMVTEKQLSETLNVRATPAIVFLDENNKQVVRVNGFRAPERFKKILDYVDTKSYKTTKLSDYLSAKLDKNVYKLRDNSLFTKATDLSKIEGPLMVIFEDGSCYDCNELHDGHFKDPRVLKEIEPYTIVRLDADSTAEIKDVNGNKTTPMALAKKNEVIYRPGILVFDEGKLLRRHDSLTYPHHFKESMRYVAGDFYKSMDYRQYSEKRTEELLAAGVTIDLGSAKIR